MLVRKGTVFKGVFYVNMYLFLAQETILRFSNDQKIFEKECETPQMTWRLMQSGFSL
jgi:hypothetical protein